ncbi:MAG: hypothetical protein IKT99_06450, partial [Oscillospiraceae bacterium]|nr:hypothetical protein [Oscillospiraceae bacterium]
MKYYLAPMEGVTDSIYRSVCHRMFTPFDRYYTPFFSPTVHRSLTPRERKELAPQPGLTVIPQILTKNAEDFIAENIWTIIKTRVADVTRNDINDVVIREGTYKETLNEDGSVSA